MNTRLAPPPRSRPSRGFSTLELLVSLPGSIVLLGSVGLCLHAMLKAKTQEEATFRDVHEVNDAMLQMTSDIEAAQSIVSFSSTHLEICVPDRNGDQLPEQIRYEWGGTSGRTANRLLWKINGSGLLPRFEGIGGMNLQYHWLSSGAIPNHHLSDYAILNDVDTSPEGSFSEFTLDERRGVGVTFRPDRTTSGWELGGLRLMLRRAAETTNGKLRIDIRAVDGNQLPSGGIFARVELAQSDLSSRYQWLDIPLAPVYRGSTDRLCVLLYTTGGDGGFAHIQCLDNATLGSQPPTMLTSSNRGNSWQTTANRQPRFLALGYAAAYSNTRRLLTAVDLQLSAAQTPGIIQHARIRLRAAPEVP
jgi:hypothetical protein